jgi:hypothetical protein
MECVVWVQIAPAHARKGTIDLGERVRNKPVARASTGLIMFGRGPAARVAVVSMS